MKKHLLLLLLGLVCVQLCISQDLSPSVISSDGGFESTSKISLEWTIGELAIDSRYSDRMMYTEGFHQPVLKVEIMNPEVFETSDFLSRKPKGLNISVRPNPVRSLLNIQIESDSDEEVNLILSTMDGRTVLKRMLDPTITSQELDVGAFPSGMYLLKFSTKNNTLIETYKISKIQ
jgi:hypothetical protein